MMIPAALYFLIFKYWPMAGIVIAFKNYVPRKGIIGSDWVKPWFQWFSYFFKSPASRQVVFNTFWISFLKLAFCMIPPMFFALAISETKFKKMSRVIQTISYLPHFLSWVIVYGICIAMFSESTGVVNMWLRNIGLKPIPFLTSNQYFRSVLVGTDLWKSIGWSSIIYLAAIMGIDTEIYDSAIIDGCGRLRRIWYITLPFLRKIFIVLLILRVGKILDAGFNQVFVFINDQVRTSAEIIDTWVYTEGLGQGRYSLSTAVGLLKSVLSCLMVFGTNALARKWDSALW
jgi:ABC-type polysaccharide transport system, permease component